MTAPVTLTIELNANGDVRAIDEGFEAETYGTADTVLLATSLRDESLRFRDRKCASEAVFRAFGTSLFGAIFSDEVLGLYRTLDQRARTGRRTFHVRLFLDAKWQTLAWEFLYDKQAAEYLAIASDRALFRLVRRITTANTPDNELSVVVLGASPVDKPLRSIAEEVSAITDALIATPKAAIRIAEKTTRAILAETLGTHRPSVVHVIAHGRRVQGAEEGELGLLAADGSNDWLSERDFSTALSGYGQLGLVTLLACDTASAGIEAFAGVGPRLVEARVPAVVAMQYPVRDAVAPTLSGAIYRSLASGHAIPDAAQEARKAIITRFGADERDAYAPVVFSRGRLFSFGRSHSRVALASAGILPASPHLTLPPDLLSRLESCLAATGAVMLSAEGGFGKTEVGRSISVRYVDRAIWIDAAAHHVDAASLVLDMVDRLDDRLGLDLSQLMRVLADPGVASTVYGRVPNRFAESLCKSLGEQLKVPALMVVDDIHEMLPELRASVLRTIVECRPPNLHVVLITGAAEPDELTKAREDRKLHVLRRDSFVLDANLLGTQFELRFGRRPSPETCERLAQVTGGWPMASILISGDDAATDQRLLRVLEEMGHVSGDLYDALLGRAYSRQNESTRQLLRRVSITSVITSEWVNSVLGIQNGAALLREIAAKNTFLVRLDQSDEWRLHPLFRDFLRQRLREEEATDRAALILRSEAFWSERGEWLSLTFDSLAMERWETAAVALERIAVFFVSEGRFAALLSLAERVPVDARRARPELCARIAQALEASGQSAKAVEELRAIRLEETSPHVGRYIRLVLTSAEASQDPESSTQAVDTLAQLAKEAVEAKDVLIASQATLRRVDLLSKGAYDTRWTDELLEELGTAETLLRSEPDNRINWEVRANLLAAGVRVAGRLAILEAGESMSQYNLERQLGRDVAPEQRRLEVLRLLGLQRRAFDLGRQSLDAATQSGSPLAHANVVYVWANYVVDETLQLTRVQRAYGLGNAEADRMRDRLLVGRLGDLGGAMRVYERFEMPSNVAMTLFLVGRIQRMLGNENEARDAIAAAHVLVKRHGLGDIEVVLRSFADGVYDYDYVERQMADYDETFGLAGADEDMVRRVAARLARFAGPGVPPQEAERTALAEVRELQGCHVARRDYCQYVSLIESEPVELGSYTKEPGLRVRLKVIRCEKFPARVSVIPYGEFDGLFGAFRRTHCDHCTSRSLAYVDRDKEARVKRNRRKRERRHRGR